MFKRKKAFQKLPSKPIPGEEDCQDKTETIVSPPSPLLPNTVFSPSRPPSPSPLPRLEVENLKNTLYYLASLIPKENSWKCHFVDNKYHTGDITKAEEGGKIFIKATLTAENDQFILLPFGEKEVWCSFPPTVEFSFSSAQGQGKIEAVHICEKGIHKLIFPEEVNIEGKEYFLQKVLPLALTHS